MEIGTLSARGLCKSYGSKRVLEHVDLDLEPGTIYGLIGRNGAGKTTLLSILTAQNTWDSGTVTYNGAPVWENRAALEHLCFSREFSVRLETFQSRRKIQHYLGAAAIFYPHWDAAYAQRLLEAFQLDPQQKLSQLSKGQGAMVTALLALASRADITFLDEPTAGLDVVMREKFYHLLLEDFAQTGRTFVLSTHIIQEAAPLFERVLILDQGRLLENASADELLSQFRTLSGRADQVELACQGLTVLTTHDLGRRRTCTVRGSAEQLAALEHFDVDAAPTNLQDIFIALCGRGDED